MEAGDKITYKGKNYLAVRYNYKEVNGDNRSGLKTACNLCDINPPSETNEYCKGINCFKPDGLLYLKQLP